jgi:hypothetical protein
MWFLNTQDRISEWRSFRKKLDKMDFHDCVHEVNNFWWKAPISNKIYCQDIVNNWPGPWELITENLYDDIARGLGMLYTIGLSRHIDRPLEFRCYRDRDLSAEYNLVWIDSGKYVLNYDTTLRVNITLETQCSSKNLVSVHNIKNLLGDKMI